MTTSMPQMKKNDREGVFLMFRASLSRRQTLLSALMCAVLLVCAVSAFAQKGPVQRVVEGKVLNDSNQGAPGAIVYLKNLKSNDIKSFIATQDGTYRFGQLSPDVDYQVWAELKDKKSATKTASSFDTKSRFFFVLHLDKTK